jgi:tetratricopeptide (TPR) repeat protein
VYDSWGISSVADDWMYADYSNPYATGVSQTVVVQQPPVVVDAAAAAPAAPQSVVAYDYSQPINVAAPPEPTAAESAQKVFEAARDSFKAGDYSRAMSLTDQALAQLPNDPSIHEFRVQCLLTAKRYDDAAAAAYAVLSAGPGWDWATMISLYPDVDAYTNQLRALEAYVKGKPDGAPGQFLLGYLYMVQGDKATAAAQFAKVARLQPQDHLSAQIAQTLTPDEARQKARTALLAEPPTPPPSPTPADGGPPAAPGAVASTPAKAPPKPPAKLLGAWTAKPDDKVAIALHLSENGDFSWAVTQSNRTQTIQGQAGFEDDVLVLGQTDGMPLTGKVQIDPSGDAFTFKPPGAATNAPGLRFMRAKG